MRIADVDYFWVRFDTNRRQPAADCIAISIKNLQFKWYGFPQSWDITHKALELTPSLRNKPWKET